MYVLTLANSDVGKDLQRARPHNLFQPLYNVLKMYSIFKMIWQEISIGSSSPMFCWNIASLPSVFHLDSSVNTMMRGFFPVFKPLSFFVMPSLPIVSFTECLR